MLDFLKKYGFYGILGVIGILSIIAFEPTLTSWLFTHTSPPIKVYKAAPFEKQNSGNTIHATPRSDAETPNSLPSEHFPENEDPDAATALAKNEISQNDNFANNEVSDGATTVEIVAVRPPKRKETSKEATAVEKKRKASQRLREIDIEMQAIAPFINKDKDIHLRFLDLWEERLKIHQDRGTLHIDGLNPFISLKIDRLVLRVMTDGKIPVSIGEKVASIYSENGHHSQAEHVRVLTQRAIEKGDDFYKPEHLEAQ